MKEQFRVTVLKQHFTKSSLCRAHCGFKSIRNPTVFNPEEKPACNNGYKNNKCGFEKC